MIDRSVKRSARLAESIRLADQIMGRGGCAMPDGAVVLTRSLISGFKEELRTNPIACNGHGICAELLPELIHLDDWRYPIVSRTEISPELLPHAERAERLCPTLAIRILRP